MQQGLIKVLYGMTKKSATMFDDDWKEFEKAVSTIHLSLAPKVSIVC